MNNEILNKYKHLGINIEKTKSRQEIFTEVTKQIHPDSPYNPQLFFLDLYKSRM